MYYTLNGSELKPLVGLVQIGGIYKNAAFMTDAEAASMTAYEKANNAPEDREGFRPKVDGYEVKDGKWATKWAYEPLSVEEMTRLYDAAMEEHLETEKNARGYTKREPTDYANSGVARFKHDADDWSAHRDAVMLYGLEVQNKAKRGEAVPTLDEFKAGLPKIVWREA